MANPEILDFIRRKVVEHVSRADIEHQLRVQGYSDQEISDAFAMIIIPVAPTPTVSFATATATDTAPHAVTSDSSSVAPTGGSLPRFSNLLGSAWSFFIERMGTLVAIALVISLPQFLLALSTLLLQGDFAKSAGGGFVAIGIALAYLFAFVFAFMWGIAALMTAVRDREQKIGFRESFSRSRSKIFSSWWVLILTGCVTLLGFILLIVPGILCGIWFSFALTVLIAENKRGMTALRTSKEYVRGHWGEVFVLNFLLGLLYIPLMVCAVIVSLITTQLASPMVGVLLQQFISLFAMIVYLPLAYIFNFMLYEHLKAIRGSVVVKEGYRWVAVLAVVFVIGLFVVGILASVVLTSIGYARIKGRDIARESEVKMIALGAELYGNQNSVYPSSVDQMAPQYLPSVPVDPLTNAPYDYQVGDNGSSYQVCATLEDASSTVISIGANTNITDGKYCMTGTLTDGMTSATTTSTSTQ